MVDFKIIKTEEKNNRLIVEIEIGEEKESFQFPIIDAEEHPETKKPMFVHKIKEILERTHKIKKSIKTKKFLKTFEKQEFNTDDIEDLSRRGMAERRKQKDQEKGDKCHEKLYPEVWAKADADIKAKRLKRTDERNKLKIDRQLQEIAEKQKTVEHCEDGSCSM